MLKKQGAFTLIELVVVIVILGILSVVASPKFIDIQDDAKVSALKGLSGGMRSGLTMFYTQAILQGQTEGHGIVVFEGEEIMTTNGYPPPTDYYLRLIITGLEDWKNLPENTSVTLSSGQTAYGYDNFACVVIYQAGASTESGKVMLKGDKCEL